MQFGQWNMIYGLIVWIVFFVFLRWCFRRKEQVFFRIAEPQLARELRPRGWNTIALWQDRLILLAGIFSVLALMRPQWGFEWQEVKKQGLDIMFVVDTSKSMLSPDIKPNRLERTKLALKDVIMRLKGDRAGLIAFAGESFEVCPLTVDYNGFRLALESLGVDIIPQGGTNITEAIKDAISGYADISNKYKAIILITDGENLEGDPLVVAHQAKEKGIKIYTVGIGTAEGELIPIETLSGERSFLKDGQGNFVKSRLDEELLKKIAAITEGVYVKASGADFGLDIIYEQYLSGWERREFESAIHKRYHERFMIFLWLAFICLCLDTVTRLDSRAANRIFVRGEHGTS